jgi:hypothetical protein
LLSFWAKSLLAATSLAPMLVCYAILYARAEPGLSGLLILIAIALVGVCKFLLTKVQKHIPGRPIHLDSVKIADQQMLTYIIAYLLPLAFAKLVEPTAARLGLLAIVFVLLIVAIYRSNGFSFNPVMGLAFGYHFYEVTTEKSFTYVVVSKRKIVNTRGPILGKELSPYMYLEAEG